MKFEYIVYNARMPSHSTQGLFLCSMLTSLVHYCMLFFVHLKMHSKLVRLLLFNWPHVTWTTVHNLPIRRRSFCINFQTGRLHPMFCFHIFMMFRSCSHNLLWHVMFILQRCQWNRPTASHYAGWIGRHYALPVLSSTGVVKGGLPNIMGSLQSG